MTLLSSKNTTFPTFWKSLHSLPDCFASALRKPLSHLCDNHFLAYRIFFNLPVLNFYVYLTTCKMYFLFSFTKHTCEIFFLFVLFQLSFFFSIRCCNVWQCHNLFILRVMDICLVLRLWLLCYLEHASTYVLVHTRTICVISLGKVYLQYYNSKVCLQPACMSVLVGQHPCQ